MLSLEALILADMFTAYREALKKVMTFGPEEQGSDDHFRAEHRYNVAHKDLVAALKTFAPEATVEYREGHHVSADSEGGLAFRNWTVRPFDARKELLQCN